MPKIREAVLERGPRRERDPVSVLARRSPAGLFSRCCPSQLEDGGFMKRTCRQKYDASAAYLSQKTNFLRLAIMVAMTYAALSPLFPEHLPGAEAE
jgi:hypothetical protein